MITLDPEVRARSVLRGLSAEELRALARHDERTTRYGSASYVSQVRNRSAKNTYVVGDGLALGVQQQRLAESEALPLIADVHRYLEGADLIQVDCHLGQHSARRLACRLYVTRPFARIAFMWHQLLFPGSPDVEPQLVTVFVPEWPERRILVLPEARTTYVLGTDYFGEAKKSFLRMAMYEAKLDGGLGFHAGSKLLRVTGGDGRPRQVGFLLFGLSGTGKTTLTVHDHGLVEPEGVVIRQDDVVLMNAEAYCYGTENGFYLKTEGLDPSQAVLYAAATSPQAILENCRVAEDGSVDFADTSLTSNGRCVVPRRAVRGTDDEVDLPRADRLVFITRRHDVVPPVARLTAEQAAAFFMLGESIETSAGDPSRAGQSKREVGTNPFIIGPEAEEGNRLLAILRRHPDIECYLLNTGYVGARSSTGEGGVKIRVADSVGILTRIARGSIRWTKDPDWGYQVPAAMDGVDIDAYDPRRYLAGDEYRRRVDALRRERQEWLARFPGLDPDIAAAIG
ncbi:MAG: phosphoenolpyruvate carboxykinase (ATP) [Clostridia bacterium]|nr:phosphoenolpyruvate carboxykinase (ATP) [Clostridia bacterium]